MEHLSQNKFLGEEKIAKLLIKFAVPCILSLLISALYNIVDQIFIGNSSLGYLGNAATAVVFPITILSLAFAWCFGDGSAAFISICQGRKDAQGSHKCAGNAILASFVSGLLFVLVCALFMDKILFAFGASKVSIGLARDYFIIILAATPLFMVMNTMSALIRVDGSPSYSMIMMLAGAVINIILDPLFIFVFNWGIKGAAWATIIGQIAAFFIALAYFFKSKTFKLSPSSFLPDFKILWGASKLGISTFITELSIVIISLVCNSMLAKYGAVSKFGQDIPIAVMGIAMKVFAIVINIVIGIILGSQPILGYNIGAKNYRRVRETFRLDLIATLTAGLLATLVFELLPGFVVNLFGVQADPLYNEFAVMTFRVFLAFTLLNCMIKLSAIFFQAVGRPVKSSVLSLVRDLICFVPLVFIFPLRMGITGILWVAPVSDAIGFVVSVCLLAAFFRTLGKDDARAEAAASVVLPSKKGVIITIAREHGSNGKYIGRLIAQSLGIPFYDKEVTALAATESGLAAEFVSEIDENASKVLHERYISRDVVRLALSAQEAIIKKLADCGSCVIVGRAADYVLREHEDVLTVFIHAPRKYRVKRIMELYGDSEQESARNIKKSDEARALYYNDISGMEWGLAHNYDLCVNSAAGSERTAAAICDYIRAWRGR